MELFDNLNEIKENLFDAPADIKSAFNNVVEYFGLVGKLKDKWSGIKDTAKALKNETNSYRKERENAHKIERLKKEIAAKQKELEEAMKKPH